MKARAFVRKAGPVCQVNLHVGSVTGVFENADGLNRFAR
jgi:hypothetical protein